MFNDNNIDTHPVCPQEQRNSVMSFAPADIMEISHAGAAQYHPVTPAFTDADFKKQMPVPAEAMHATLAIAQSPPDKAKPTEKGISSLSELKSLEVLRMEFASSTFKPKVILSYESISFNKACLKLLPGARHVNVLIDRSKKRIIILPVKKHAKDALQWCGVSRDGDVKKRICTAKKFGEKLYDMMQWIKENKYRVLAYFQEVEGVQLLVFNLCECEMVVPDFVTTATGKVIKRGKVYLPGEWEGGFGMPLLQHEKANTVELDAHYTLSDKDLDVTIADMRIRGRIPVDEELIMSQYRKEKPQELSTDA